MTPRGPAPARAPAPPCGKAVYWRLSETVTACVAADRDPFDVVITDNNMPGVSGIELVRQLRERNFSGKIMVLSAYLSVDVRAAYEAMEVDAMMEKPFNVQALRQALDRIAA